MPLDDLIVTASCLSRLLHPRYRNKTRLMKAHQYLRLYAEINNLDEEWCDAVLLLFLDNGESVLTNRSVTDKS